MHVLLDVLMAGLFRVGRFSHASELFFSSFASQSALEIASSICFKLASPGINSTVCTLSGKFTSTFVTPFTLSMAGAIVCWQVSHFIDGSFTSAISARGGCRTEDCHDTRGFCF
jgi:hypothetical protein